MGNVRGANAKRTPADEHVGDNGAGGAPGANVHEDRA